VYVCLPESDDEMSSYFTREDGTIQYWELLHQSRERAEVDQY
jgi:hypothetical protein